MVIMNYAHSDVEATDVWITTHTQMYGKLLYVSTQVYAGSI